MKGTIKVIVSEETANGLFEKYVRTELFKDGDFIIADINKRSYEKEWTITLEGNEVEAADATES